MRESELYDDEEDQEDVVPLDQLHLRNIQSQSQEKQYYSN